jgi:hypothetical protein
MRSAGAPWLSSVNSMIQSSGSLPSDHVGDSDDCVGVTDQRVVQTSMGVEGEMTMLSVRVLAESTGGRV